ncbi:hypothetical protein ACIA6D_30525 [Streptomyces cacaoi]
MTPDAVDELVYRDQRATVRVMPTLQLIDQAWPASRLRILIGLQALATGTQPASRRVPHVPRHARTDEAVTLTVGFRDFAKTEAEQHVEVLLPHDSAYTPSDIAREIADAISALPLASVHCSSPSPQGT